MDSSPPGSCVHGIFQAYWIALPFPPPGDLPDPGIEPVSPESLALQADSLPLEPQGMPLCYTGLCQIQGPGLVGRLVLVKTQSNQLC